MRKSTAAREKNMPPFREKNNTAHSNDITDIKGTVVPAGRTCLQGLFHPSLLPGTEHILGVRLPALRKIARKLAKKNWLENLARCNRGQL